MCGVFGKVRGILYHVYFCFCLECDGSDVMIWRWRYMFGYGSSWVFFWLDVAWAIAQFCATHLFIFGSEFGSVKLGTFMQRSPGDA